LNVLRYKAGTLIFFLGLALASFLCPRAPVAAAAGAPPQRAQTNRRRARVDYTNFSRRTPQHQRACDSCHKFPSANWQQARKKDDAFPDVTEYPQHASCLDCHRAQFFARERPAPAICSVCHVASSPRNTTRFPFPTLAAFAAAPKGQGFASAFRIHFPHDKHIEIVGQVRPTHETNDGVRYVSASFAQDQQPAQKPAPAPTEAAPRPALDCQGCHGPGKTLPFLGGELFHKGAHKDYGDGFHAKALRTGRRAATCLDCHATDGDMTTMRPPSDPRSTVSRANVAATCGRCHGDPKRMQGSGITDRPFLTYEESAHARAVARGSFSAAVCTDCHRSHDILPAADARSPIFKFNVPQTCARCHPTIQTEYAQSVHGRAAARGVSQTPVCTDCHGVHNILPSSDPRSMIAAGNLTQTCGQCHPGASENFARGKVHLDVPVSRDAGSTGVRWVRLVYLPIIFLTVGGMALHNLLAWRRKAAARRAPSRASRATSARSTGCC
jgi:nitrate/TMAO reductase-like tetraheme cytochrome c subunit